MVIDPMNKRHAENMLIKIREVTQAPIKYLFYSHNHYDHAKGGQVFKDEGAEIISHIGAYEYIKANPSPDLVLPDTTWSGDRTGYTLGGTTLELYYVGVSHGNGMTTFVIPREKVTCKLEEETIPGLSGGLSFKLYGHTRLVEVVLMTPCHPFFLDSDIVIMF